MKIYSKIVEGNVPYPPFMSSSSRDLIAGLCTVNPSKRLGNISGGSERVKSHAFFRGVNWEALYYRKEMGPIVPRVRHAADASNFDEYGPPEGVEGIYTDELKEQYESAFADF